jgi:multiple sugar transport system permease protein
MRWLRGTTKGVLILLFSFWSLFPIYLVITSSLKPVNKIFEIPPSFTFPITFESYVKLWTEWPQYFNGLINSAIITVGATVLTVIGSAFAGWVYARYSSRWLTLSSFSLVVLRMLPPIIITLPLFPVANRIGFNDTHLLLILLYATFFVSLGAWIMRAFFNQIPRELEEAAASDGASFWQTLWHISMPLGVPGMIASAVFVFIFAWNEYLFAFIFTTSTAKTAPVTLSEMMGATTGVDWGVVFAAASIQLIPIMVFVIIVQKYLVAGLTAGSVKG